MARAIDVTNIVDLDDEEDGGEGYCVPIFDHGGTEKSPISVEDYSEDRELNLALLASLQTAAVGRRIKSDFIDLSRDDYGYVSIDDDIILLDFAPKSYHDSASSSTPSPGSSRRKPFRDSSTEKGQSSNSNPEPETVILCEICAEPRTPNSSFQIKGCSHVYCKDCMAKYVASKLQDNISKVGCPVSGCEGVLEPEYCRSILPPDVFERWGNALCEAVILGAQKFYCPFKDCSAMLLDDSGGGGLITQAECPNCYRLFCARCKVPWHCDIDCVKFQKLHKNEREREDIMLMNLADKQLWKRCPNCKIYVERTAGCRYIKCRCGISFCYGCAGTQINSGTHVCPRCG
ncbi:unnamed protein product [Linum tenue]|uniref:RBR-type E3 ubiquitin transferase n=2 Tax=Linum tenue TaxID=586396 RepID=A0AAV0QS64_9ROSI|nr:unnamed protein product [Linum tenue]